MLASTGNSEPAQVFIKLAKEAFDEARANLELASILVKNGESYLQLAVTADAMNDLNEEDSPADCPKGDSNSNNSLIRHACSPEIMGESKFEPLCDERRDRA
jgi:hypothetical protein